MIARGLRRTLPAFSAALFLAITGAALGQNPAAPGDAAQRPHRAMPNPVNLQVLPKDTSGADVIKIMHGFTGDLGVECGYCHAKSADTGRLDFPSDANPMKNRARVMMRMTHAINTTYLTQLTDPPPANPVSCGTCHRGMSKPSVFVPAPQQRGPRPPMPPGPGASGPPN